MILQSDNGSAKIKKHSKESNKPFLQLDYIAHIIYKNDESCGGQVQYFVWKG